VFEIVHARSSQREHTFDGEAFLLEMWIRYLLTPTNPNPDLTGAFDLGEVGSAREKKWSRVTPYSVARPSMLSEGPSSEP
jgi:hypothetical protein